ncbi:putative phage abortive infection protein [Enterobacter asburiae]|nr:putative phage abortive infection protein [Enterobacter asburiae]
MIIFLMILILVLALFYWNAVAGGYWPFDGMALTDTGVFGDSWGAFTSIFSALGFCGVLWTIKLQIDATKKLEKDAIKKEEFERIRDFETSFFNMLNLLQIIIKDMRIESGDLKSKREGRSVVMYFYLKFKRRVTNKLSLTSLGVDDLKDVDIEYERERLQNEYDIYFLDRSGNLSHYYRFLYNIFKFIHDAKIDDGAKQKYAKILRAQISNYELLILFYNGKSKHGEKFEKYFKEYAVFDNLPVYKLCSNAHVLFYSRECWGDNSDAIDIISIFEG